MTIQHKLRKILLDIDTINSELRSLTTTIDLAGQQRMLSQKVMKLYVLSKSKNHSSSHRSELMDSLQIFDSNLFTLMDSNLNTEKINNQLEKVRLLWHHFKSAIEVNDLDTATDLNNQVLYEMNLAVMYYVDLSGVEN